MVGQREGILRELDRAGIRRDVTVLDLEVAADMAACVVPFRCFAWGESASTEPAPEIISGSLFTQREIQFQRQRYNCKTIRRQIGSDGTARMANVGSIRRRSEGYDVRTVDREETMRQDI